MCCFQNLFKLFIVFLPFWFAWNFGKNSQVTFIEGILKGSVQHRQRNIKQTIKCELRVNQQKPRPFKPLKCFKSKTISHGKLKSPHHVDLIRSTLVSFLGLIVLDLQHFKVLGGLVFVVVHPLYFNNALLCQKLIDAPFCRKIRICALFCRPESFERKSLLSGKFSTFLPLGPRLP